MLNTGFSENGQEIVEVSPEIAEGVNRLGQMPVNPPVAPRYVPPPQYNFYTYQAPPAPFQYRQYAPAYPNYGPVRSGRR